MLEVQIYQYKTYMLNGGGGGAGQRYTPVALPQESDSLHRRLHDSRGRFGRVWKIPFSSAFKLQTVQTVESRYTVCAIPAALYEDSVWECEDKVDPMHDTKACGRSGDAALRILNFDTSEGGCSV